MNGAEFKAIRLRLPPELFAEFIPEPKPGPGRKPSGDVTHEVIGAYLEVHPKTVSRWEAGLSPIPPLVAREMARLADTKRATKAHK